MPVSRKGTLVQYAGRLHRLHPGKTEVRIYDYVDRKVPLFLRMFEKRLRGYRAIGYMRDDDTLNDGANSGELPVNDGTAKTHASPSDGRRVGQGAAAEPGRPHRPPPPRGDPSKVRE